MENATDTMILDSDLFIGFVKESKQDILRTLFLEWKISTKLAHRTQCEFLDAQGDELREVLGERLSRRHTHSDTLFDLITGTLSRTAKGKFDSKRYEDARDIAQATANQWKVETQKEYWDAKEAEKEEALKAEYMAGFDAWKATQAGA